MALASPPSTSPGSRPGSGPSNPPPPSTSFDIVAHYNATTKRDPSISPALAAMESLIALLSENPLTTIAETLALLSHQTTVLLDSQRNPIPPSAGADLFQRYMISSFQARPSFLQHADFTALRKHLISNSRLFIQRAKTASTKIAAHALAFIKDDSLLFLYSSTSPTISSIISATAESTRYISLAHITTPTRPGPPITTTQKPPNPNAPTTTLPLHELTYALSSLTTTQLQSSLFIVPASAVLENGSIISPLGTHQLALLASAYNIPFYVAVESFKFVHAFPLGSGQADLARMGARQPTLVFGEAGEGEGGEKQAGDEGPERKKKKKKQKLVIENEEEKVDITPPELITALITENGAMTPSAVSEELIKLWF